LLLESVLLESVLLVNAGWHILAAVAGAAAAMVWE
jgi:hypothetical protein